MPSPKLPKSITVPLEPGTTWGGVIRDEQGQAHAPQVARNPRRKTAEWISVSEFAKRFQMLVWVEGL